MNEGDGATTANETKRSHWVMAEPAEADGDGMFNPLGLVGVLALFALLWFRGGPGPFVVVVGLLLMIMLHELGHFMTARWAGMKVTQFFMFMGPRVWSIKRGEVEYGLRALPLGGFVRIVGMHNLDPIEPGEYEHSYMAKPFRSRMMVITAGSVMHMIQALILFVVLSSVIGMPDSSQWQIEEIRAIEDGPTPAADAGLEPGETIVRVDGQSSEDFRDLQAYLQSRPNEVVTLDVQGDQGDAVRSVEVTLAEIPLENGESIGFLGIAPRFEQTRRSPLVGAENFAVAGWEVLKVVPRLLAPSTYFNLLQLVAEGPEDVSITSEEAQTRPVSVYGVARMAAQPEFDWVTPISILALVNLFVGFFNLLPMLPLDGGHAAIAIYERARSRRGKRHHVDVAKLLPVTWAVVVMLGVLMLTTLWLDIARPIG